MNKLHGTNGMSPALGVVLCVAAVVIGCSKQTPASKQSKNAVLEPLGAHPFIFIYAPCTVNATYLDPYGSELGLTPNLAEFAASAATFTAHRTEAGYSGAAYASILTSQHADGHKVYDHPQAINADLYDLSEALADNGYEVFYMGGHPMASTQLNYVQGAIASWNEGPTAMRVLLEALAKNSEGRRVAVIGVEIVTHTPYLPTGLMQFTRASEEFEALSVDRVNELTSFFYDNLYALKYRFSEFVAKSGLSETDVRELVCVVETLYRLNIQRLDSGFGFLLDAVGEDALVVFTADHGESLYNPREMNQWSHSGTLSSDVLNVPLMIAGPGIEPGRHAFVTRSIDIAPTIAGILGLELPESIGWTGFNLAPVLRGESEAPSLTAFSHTEFREGIPGDFAGRRGRLVAWYRTGVYSVRDVRDESADIFDRTDPLHLELVDALGAYQNRMVDAYTAATTLTPEEREEMLRSLGYIE